MLIKIWFSVYLTFMVSFSAWYGFELYTLKLKHDEQRKCIGAPVSEFIRCLNG